MWVRNGGRVGAAVHLLQDRGLHLEEAAAAERIAQRFHDGAAGLEQAAGIGVDGEVDVPLPDAGLRVGQALPLVRQGGVQALAGHAPLVREQRQRSAAAVSDDAGDLDEVTEVELGGERPDAIGADPGLVDEDLDVAGPVPDHREHDAP